MNRYQLVLLEHKVAVNHATYFTATHFEAIVKYNEAINSGYYIAVFLYDTESQLLVDAWADWANK